MVMDKLLHLHETQLIIYLFRYSKILLVIYCMLSTEDKELKEKYS